MGRSDLANNSFSDYEVIRCLRSSFKWTSYLAKDKTGNLVTLTYFDKDKMIERYKVSAFQNGANQDNIETEAKNFADDYEESIRQSVERIKGLGNDHVGTTFGLFFDTSKKQTVVVSEYIQGVDLFYASGRLKPNQLICLFAQALDGISFIHKSGFLHLNLKPSRICVDFDGEKPNVMVTDFGLGIPLQGYTGKYNGTLFYMAPEVILEKRSEIDDRADLFSFAVTMYYCLTGHQPLGDRFAAHSNKSKLSRIVESEKSVFIPPSHYNSEVSAEMDELVLGLLEKEPSKRKFRTAGNLLNFMYEKWPKESHQMARESTSTLVSYD